VFDKVVGTVVNNSGVPPRDLCLRVELRKIDLREDVRHRVTPSEQVVNLFDRINRGLEIRCSIDDEPRRTDGPIRIRELDLHGRRRCVLRKRLSCTAERAKHIRSDDPLAAKAAKYGLIVEADRNGSRSNAIRYASGPKIIGVFTESVA